MRGLLLCVASAVALWSGAAHAAIDPINWCPDGPSAYETPSINALRPVFEVQRADIVAQAAFSPSERVADLLILPAPPRRLASAEPETKLGERQLMFPVWVEQGFTDPLKQGSPAYCGLVAEPPPERRNGFTVARFGQAAVCIQADGNAFGARLAAPAADARQYQGRMSLQGPSFARGRPWGVLGDAEPPLPAETRALKIGRIELTRNDMTGVWNRPAFNRVSVQFEVSGFPPFQRGLNDPLKLGGTLLVVTDVSMADGARFQRMTPAQWTAWQAEKCPTAAR